MRLVNGSGVIQFNHFRCMDTNQEYKIVCTRNTFEGKNFWDDSTAYSMDTVKRLSDGKKVDFKRLALSQRFKNVIQLCEQIEGTPKAKRKKNSTKKSDLTKNNYDLRFRNGGA